jgi:hypothetical protein
MSDFIVVGGATSLTSQLDVINMALDYLDEEYAIEDTDDRPSVQLMLRNFDQTARGCLRRHPWNFALIGAKIETPTTRTFGWKYEYDLPEAAIRLVSVRCDEIINATPVPYELLRRKILTNEPTQIYIRYVAYVEWPDMTDPLFNEFLALALALRCAHAITHKQSYVERLSGMLKEALDEAKRIDSLEGTAEEAQADYWDNARFAEGF